MMPGGGGSKYNSKISEIRQTEFGHAAGITYLDHAGATLYSKSQLEAHFKDLASSVYGNPHSQSQSSSLTTESINHVRRLVLQHFNTTSSEYDVVFTSGCTGALKLLAESFPFSSGAQSFPIGGGAQSFPISSGAQSFPISSGNPSFPNSGCENSRHYGTRQSDWPGNAESLQAQVWYRGNAITSSEFCLPGQSVFCYLEDNHTSVVGVREVAARRGAALACVTGEDVLLLPGNAEEAASKLRGDARETLESREEEVESSWGDSVGPHPLCPRDHAQLPSVYHLFAYPAQSNFSGRKYPLRWASDLPLGRAHLRGLEGLVGAWLVLLDAAAYVPTSPLDLSSSPAHFVCLSFYKMFGYPTGLGALLVRRDVGHLLCKDYYGGGTVLASISRDNFHIAKHLLHERFEDGTLPFLEIAALVHGFSTLQRLAGSMEEISIHTWSLARYVYHHLKDLMHYNGQPVCVMYCDSDFEDRTTQGAIVSFNFLRPVGGFVGYSEVDKLASVHNIHLRTGCFCNTGACMRFLGLSSKKVMENIKAGHVCGGDVDMVDGVPTGCARVSFGYMSTFSDAQKFVEFVKQCFVNKRPHTNGQSMNAHHSEVLFVSTHPSEVLSMNTHPSEVLSVSTHPSEVLSMNARPSEVLSVNTHPSEVLSMNTHPSEVLSVNTHPSEVLSVNTHPSEVLSVNTHPSEVLSMNTGLSGDGMIGLFAPVIPCGVACISTLPPHPHPAANAARSMSLCVGDIMLTAGGRDGGTVHVTLEKIFLYPIKSCAAFEVSSWQLGAHGFQYDRLWMVVNERGSCVSQKQEPRLCLVRPVVDPGRNRMVLSAEGHGSISVPLEVDAHISRIGVCQTTVCGDKVNGSDVGEEAAMWLSAVIGRRCRLWRQDPQDQRKAKRQPNENGGVTLSLANEAPFLLVSRPSIEHLLSIIRESTSENSFGYNDVLMRFRPNLVVAGGMPFEEDGWTEIATGSAVFKVTGLCSRCQMICVDQSSGKRNTEPLQVLLSFRGSKATFGVYLAADN